MALFSPVPACWVCGRADAVRVHECRFDLDEYRSQDPELAAYTGQHVWIRRCRRCGFGQPEALPALPRYFERMYDQRWSDEWIAREFESGWRTYIFDDVLRELGRRLPAAGRSLVDVGAHVGRFVHAARRHGWVAEGVEMNARTADYAARRTGAPIHRMDARDLADSGRRYDAATLLDVLEHIPEPVALLRTLASLLGPSGWAAVKVPCGPNQLLKERIRARLVPGRAVSVADNLVHVNHFSPRSLRLALERAGFTDVRVLVGAPELPQPGARPLWASRANAGRLALYRLARALPGGVRSPLAFNLQAFARRADEPASDVAP